MGFGATFGAATIATAVVGVVLAQACYFVVPWGRVVDAEGAPDGVDVVRLTRLGTTVGALSLVPTAAGAWLEYAGVVAGLETGEPVPFGRVARTVPGEMVLVGGLALGVVAVLAPVWVGLGVRVRRAVADETER
jgi:hypothetical protein